MTYVSDDEVTDINELLARISEAISEQCDNRTEFLRNSLSVERIVQGWPVHAIEEWVVQELKLWNVAEHPQVAYLLSLARELCPYMSSDAKTSIRQYCESNVGKDTDHVLFNQLAAEISEGYLL